MEIWGLAVGTGVDRWAEGQMEIVAVMHPSPTRAERNKILSYTGLIHYLSAPAGRAAPSEQESLSHDEQPDSIAPLDADFC